ncbi:MAG: Crp/Fnr family transcriptional regulator [Microvirga sp.]
MTDRPQSSIRNQILAGMPAGDFAVLQPSLETVRLELNQTLIEPERPIGHVWFMESGFTSIVTGNDGMKVEIGLVGREGMVGVTVLLGTDRSPFEHFIQSAGDSWRMPAERLVAAAEERPSLRRRLLRYAQALNVQSSRTAYANAEYPIEARLARWLLMCHDRTDGNDIQITHDFIAMMLAVRRAGVTTATHVLEGNRLIRAARGVITILDRRRLELLADDAYGLPEREYARLMSED